MIFINSIPYERSTNDVIDWLSDQMPFLRINPNDLVKDLIIDYSNNRDLSLNIIFSINGRTVEISLSDISSYWYRRGGLNNNINKPVTSQSELDIENYLEKEWGIITDFIFKQLARKRKLGNINDNQINKLEVLIQASSMELIIPHTFVTNRQHRISIDSLITKGIYNGSFLIENKFHVNSLTQRVDFKDSSLGDSNFFPSLFQAEIKKKYELRIFYFNGEFYSSAILSQSNIQTEVDFRNYDQKKPNRVVSYKVPKDIEEKIHKLMLKLNMETGSIDMIVTHEDEFVFLEVNPIGQFSQVSIPCNYSLEEKIANYLLNA